jgi:hypothetical protein
MAIVIEQEKRPVNWFMIVSTVIVLGVVFVGGYIVLFKKPELIESVVPTELAGINQLSRVQFKPREIVESRAFSSLSGNYSTPLTVPPHGKENPFKPF